ncbi:hypothetical protein [Rubrimonas sp.]|uniref:hypothetical protein n=1 Tax=Rubrimonas sp. TaxID=2036015 RepID=UPI002FDDF1DD
MVRLWRGELPLGEAYWTHAVLGVAAANLLATALALLLLAREVHPAAALAVWFAPVPYVLAAVVGVWRSADRAAAGPTTAALARWTAALWGLLMVLA